jgi:hypothetical protein
MIDSILLKIPYSGPINPVVFPNEKSHSSRNQWRVRTLIPISQTAFKEQKLYVPVVWIEQRRHPIPITEICVQVSLPKVCFGSNYYEINKERIDFTMIKLLIMLKSIYDLHVSGVSIRAARVCRIDFSMQFEVPLYLGDAKDLINFLYTAGYRPRTECVRRDIAYGKSGYWLKFYNTAQSITFYDKFLELLNNAHTIEDAAVIKHLNDLHKTGHILRYEVSLFKAETIRRVAKQCHIPIKKHYTLTDIVDHDLAWKCLNQYFATTFTESFDQLYFIQQDTVRKQVRNYAHYGHKIMLYFLLEEIMQRGQKVVWDEIKLLQGRTVTARLKRMVTLFLKQLPTANNSTMGPLAWMQQQLKIKI